MRSAAAALLLAGSTIAASATEATAPRTRPAPAGGGAKVCLLYANRIGLAGRLIRRTYPGPPNYESVARGDRPETVLVLALTKPACMAEDKTDRDGTSPAIARITEVQLAATTRDLGGIKPGRALRVTGQAFAAHTGHHHTPIILGDVRVEPSP
ncbi:hypothetical protein JCM2811A_31110 [Methylorubrum rhodinum]